MEILLWIGATKEAYDLNDPEELIRMRRDLAGVGFFFYPENKQYYEMFERHAKKEEVESLIGSIMVFEVKSGMIRLPCVD